ncbi:hypothetical protein H6G64_26250 [Calothrix sp. FACHB-156]|nr:hypothetical protein [Nostoc linckia FACHB-104]MBD2340475.1 hypothetical protein [Calothrix sp. FACHB-156]
MKKIKPDERRKPKENSKIMQLGELTELSDEELELVVGGTETVGENASISIGTKKTTVDISDVMPLAWTPGGGGSTGGTGGGGNGGSGGW